jgi:hypothetical protein
MARIWNTPVFILATVYFVADGILSHVTRPITAWIAKKKLFERMRLWVTSLRPYPSLALFAVPVIILEPAKPLAGYLLGTGHFFAGAVTFVTAEVLKLTFVEQLFQLNRAKLLSIPAFAWGYQYWRHMMEGIAKTGSQGRTNVSGSWASPRSKIPSIGTLSHVAMTAPP